MLILADAEVVLPDRVLSPGWILIDAGRTVQVEAGRPTDTQTRVVSLAGRRIVPGFVDVHVHGLLGHDVLEGPAGLASVACDLPRFGVTAFCPTAVACRPSDLRRLVDGVSAARARPAAGARILPVHFESNFINPEYRGAQPRTCLRLPPTWSSGGQAGSVIGTHRDPSSDPDEPFEAADIVAEFERAIDAIGIVTLAPELPGALPLIRWLAERGVHASLGHSDASFEQGLAAIDAGAHRGTHLFNRMPPLHHRAPGLVGALLVSEQAVVEIIGDGFHLHPSVIQMVVETKRPSRTMAVTDGTAASGLPVGARTRLGSETIRVGAHAAELEDGTLAGSSTTMDRVFGLLVGTIGLSPVDAAWLCATTPAAGLGLDDMGSIEPGKHADLVILDPRGRVESTYIGGTLVFSADSEANGPEEGDGTSAAGAPSM